MKTGGHHMRHDIPQLIEVIPSAFQARLTAIAANAVARVLKINVPPVKFFYRTKAESLLGYVDDEVIFVAADLDDKMVARVVIHEARHIWQEHDPQLRVRSNAAKERDAKLFELEWPR
jgi:predicted aminopeptidase